jgi:hypothetical protein
MHSEIDRNLEIQDIVQQIRELVYKIVRICTNRQESYRIGCKLINIVRNNLFFYYYD